ncbi:hypothetical protein ACOMHN_024976 [Nucella lapillus]
MAPDRKYCCTSGRCGKILHANLLVILTLAGVVVGFLLSFGLRTLQPSVDAIIWIGLPGEVYMRMLKMMILPLIICSVITGTASLDPKGNGRVSMVALNYMTLTNIIPCYLATALACLINPGAGVKLLEASEQMTNGVMETQDIFADLIRVTPIGVTSLVAVPLLQTGHLGTAVRSLGMFSLTVVSSLALYQFLVVPLYYFLLTRENAFAFLLTLGRPCMVSFATTSSAIAIPETLQCVEGVGGVDPRVIRFVVPLASSINRDGTCAFITNGCIFIAQLNDLPLDAAQIVMIWVLTVLIAMASPSVSRLGVMAIIIVLTALSIPSQAIGLLFATKWILDRLRAATNAVSHAFCAKVTFHLCKRFLQPLPCHDVSDDVTIVIDGPSTPSQDVMAKNTDVTGKLLSENV